MWVTLEVASPQWLEAGLGFHSQRFRPCCALGIPVVTDGLSPWFAEKDSHKRRSSGTGILSGKRVQYMWIDTLADSERERFAPLWVCITFIRWYLWVSFGQSFSICLVHSPQIVYLRLSIMGAACLSQDGFYRKAYGWVSLDIIPLWPPRSPSACVVGEVSWLREWGICGLGRVRLLLCCPAPHLGVSVRRNDCLSVCLVGPIYLLPQRADITAWLPILEENCFTIKYNVWNMFSEYALFHFEEIPILIFSVSSFMNGYWTLLNTFSASIEIIIRRFILWC